MIVLPLCCSADGSHGLYYEAGWRAMTAGAVASKPVKYQTGDFLRSVLGFNWLLDNRDSRVMHTEVGFRGGVGFRACG
jgi:hypothetical protein